MRTLGSSNLPALFWAAMLCTAALSCAPREAPAPAGPQPASADAETSPPQEEGPAAEYEQVRIGLERTACYGTCPVYTLTIDQDGRVQYDGKMFVAAEGRRTRQIDPGQVREIVAFALSIDFFGLRNRYEPKMQVADLPTTITSLQLDGRRKRVENYAGAPEQLRRLETMIDEAAGVAEWVGPRQAPGGR